MIRKTLLAGMAVAAFAVTPAIASAATYTANMTFQDIGGGHSYVLTVDCATGAYTGTGDDPAYTGGEALSGTLTSTSNTGNGAYNAMEIGSYPGYTYSYDLTSSDGATYTGTLSDSDGGTYSVTSLISNSTQATDCAPPPPPTPASKADCKKGGFATLYRANGTSFKNQGDCVSYVETGK